MTPRLVWLCIIVLLIVLSQPVASSAASTPQSLSVIVDGRLITLNPPAFVRTGRALVPLRGTVEAMRARVSFLPPRTIVITRGARIVQLEIGNRLATVNGTHVAMDVPAIELKGYTYVPLRFVGESLGAIVRFHPGARIAEIITPTESEESFPMPPPVPETQPVPAPPPPADAQPIPSPSPAPKPARPTVIFPLPGTSVGNPVSVQGTAPGATRVRVTVSVPGVGIPVGSAEASVLPVVGVFSASVSYLAIFSGLPLTINVVAIDAAGMESEPVTVVVRQQ